MIVVKSEISSETALRLVQGAVAYDERNSWKICSAVTDRQAQQQDYIQGVSILDFFAFGQASVSDSKLSS